MSKKWNFPTKKQRDRKNESNPVTLTNEEIAALKAAGDEYKYPGHRDSVVIDQEQFRHEHQYSIEFDDKNLEEDCPKTQKPRDEEKCIGCGYNTGEDDIICKFGEVSLSHIQAERDRELEQDIAQSNRDLES